jgi:hypothetical protein
MIRFSCPRCRSTLSAPAEYAGRVSKCKCGQQLIVPALPGQPPAGPGSADKTALGQMVAHSPTNLPPQPGAQPRQTTKTPAQVKIPSPPQNADKTALGEPVAHTPILLRHTAGGAKAPQAKKPGPQAHVLGSTPFRLPQSSGARIFLFCLLVFVLGVVLAGGLFWFLTSQEASGPSADTALAQGPKGKISPAATADKSQQARKSNEKPAPKPEIPPNVAPLIAKLQKGTEEEKVKAAEQLALMGDKAKEAARALCEATVGPSKEVSRSALQALEKVAPELYEPVFTLVVDGQAANHLKAIGTLRGNGTKAKPAVPVLLHQIQKCQADLSNQLNNGFGGGWQAETLVQVITKHLTTLSEVTPEDPEVVKTIIGTAKLSIGHPILVDNINGLTNTPFRSTGIILLGKLAGKRPEHRKTIIPELVTMLEKSVARINQAQDLNPVNVLADVEFVGDALLKCGPEVKETLRKSVLPRLKDLEFHKDAPVRSAAKELRKRIEAGPTRDDIMVLRLAATRRPVKLAVTAMPSYDDIGELLTKLGQGFTYTTIQDIDLRDLKRLNEFDVVFLTCATSTSQDIHQNEALRRFVEKGGTLYASCWRFDCLLGAFPEYIDKEAMKPGQKTEVEAKLLDKGLRELLGLTVRLGFELPGWKPAAFHRNKVTVAMEGTYPADSGGLIENAPLLVKFAHKKGTVIFTSFHNNKQLNSVTEKLLNYLVFRGVNARAEAEVRARIEEKGSSPRLPAWSVPPRRTPPSPRNTPIPRRGR